jgi:hypothetical protein
MGEYHILYITDVGDPETPPELIECPDDRAARENAILLIGDRLRARGLENAAAIFAPARRG